MNSTDQRWFASEWKGSRSPFLSLQKIQSITQVIKIWNQSHRWAVLAFFSTPPIHHWEKTLQICKRYTIIGKIMIYSNILMMRLNLSKNDKTDIFCITFLQTTGEVNYKDCSHHLIFWVLVEQDQHGNSTRCPQWCSLVGLKRKTEKLKCCVTVTF